MTLLTWAARCFLLAASWAAARWPRRWALAAADAAELPWLDDPVPHEDEDEELELPHPPPQAMRVGISRLTQNARDRTIAFMRWSHMICPGFTCP